MSSILEALKKAEQESTMDHSAGTPWPAPLPMQSRYLKRSRRWWVLLGVVVGLCVAGVVRWQVRQPDMTRLADSMPALPSQSLPKIYHGVPPPVAEAPKPGVPIAEQPQAPPDKALMDASPRQAAGNAPASEVQAEKQPLRQTAVSTSAPVAAPASAITACISPCVRERRWCGRGMSAVAGTGTATRRRATATGGSSGRRPSTRASIAGPRTPAG